MKEITFIGQVKSVRDLADRSANVTIGTPELSGEEFVDFRDLRDMNLSVYLRPLDFKAESKLNIDTEAGQKSPSQRLRGVIYRWWESKGKKQDFELFYRACMNKLIDDVKEKLN